MDWGAYREASPAVMASTMAYQVAASQTLALALRATTAAAVLLVVASLSRALAEQAAQAQGNYW